MPCGMSTAATVRPASRSPRKSASWYLQSVHKKKIGSTGGILWKPRGDRKYPWKRNICLWGISAPWLHPRGETSACSALFAQTREVRLPRFVVKEAGQRKKSEQLWHYARMEQDRVLIDKLDIVFRLVRRAFNNTRLITCLLQTHKAQFGQTVVIVGSHPLLGKWVVGSSSGRMTCQGELWTCRVQVRNQRLVGLTYGCSSRL